VPDALLDAASLPYRAVGRFAYHYARGKLGGDPAYRALLERGLLRDARRVLDLGCGQGLLAVWLRAAEHCTREGSWPAHWAPAPQGVAVRGIELMARDVQWARRALGSEAEVIQGDIRVIDFASADAVVILDVLHYLPPEAQRAVLERVRRALPPSGLLLLRVGDATGGLRFRLSLYVDKTVMLARGHGLMELHCHSLAHWRVLLTQCGFDSEAVPMSEGTPFANVLLIARAR